MANRTALFSRRHPGGVFTIEDIPDHPGDIWFVDGNSSQARDADGYGVNPDYPFATIDYAIGKCTANAGDVIYVMPGHTETVAAASAITCDKANLRIIGLPTYGSKRPTITFATLTTATIVMSAASVVWENFIFANSKDALVVAFPVTAAHCGFRNCEFIDGAAINTIDWITLSAAADDFVLEDCVNKGTDTAGNDSFISIGATSNVKIVGLRSNGDFAAANIEFTAAGIDVLIAHCYLENANAVDVNIEGYAALTGWIAYNSCRIATDSQTTWVNTPGAASLFENYGVNADGETGMIVGTAST